ncbi:hypothetical protein G6F40_017140 [Rhizopus arrhizus]|nr:hypothetical protein G6F40_017140 [Rhizopus arrhizus]
MATGGAHPVACADAREHRHRLAAVGTGGDRRSLQRAVGRIDHPHAGGTVATALQRAQRQLQAAVAAGAAVRACGSAAAAISRIVPGRRWPGRFHSSTSTGWPTA